MEVDRVVAKSEQPLCFPSGFPCLGPNFRMSKEKTVNSLMTKNCRMFIRTRKRCDTNDRTIDQRVPKKPQKLCLPPFLVL
jgi:hypothetical protein